VTVAEGARCVDDVLNGLLVACEGGGSPLKHHLNTEQHHHVLKAGGKR
jgi:hypothetical protein